MSVAADEDGMPPPRAPRTNLLLAATIGSDFGDTPVRIRNLSEGGAMLEGAVLPGPGERLTLQRAQLSVGAVVAWRTGNRCGVRFDRTVSVAQWASGLKQPTGQAEVDARQIAMRSGSVAVPSPAVDMIEAIERRVAEEIGLIARMIEMMGDDLAEEPAVVHRHPGTLQNFDLAAQMLRHLARILAAEDRAGAIAAIGMDDLRARLLRRAIF